MKTVYIQCDYLLGCAGPSGELTDLIHDPIVVSDIIRQLLYTYGINREGSDPTLVRRIKSRCFSG